jgi:hypothetical protein
MVPRSDFESIPFQYGKRILHSFEQGIQKGSGTNIRNARTKRENPFQNPLEGIGQRNKRPDYCGSGAISFSGESVTSVD